MSNKKVKYEVWALVTKKTVTQIEGRKSPDIKFRDDKASEVCLGSFDTPEEAHEKLLTYKPH